MIKKLIEDMSNNLVTGREFDNLLKSYLADEFHGAVKVKYELRDKDGTTYTYGVCDDERSTSSALYDLEDGYEVNISVWQKKDELKKEDCKELFFTYWNKEFCDSTCGLPATDRGSFTEKCNNTIKKWQKENKSIAVIMMDLDHFKEVNDKYDHEVGTQLLSTFSRILFNAIGGKGILIHQSGDEFDLLLVYEDYIQILELMHSIYKAVCSHDFIEAPDIDLTMSIGVWIIDSNEEADFLSVRTKAENVYAPKEKNTVKQRNSIRFDKKNNLKQYGKNSIKLALIRILGNIHNSKLFHNVYLDYISNFVSKLLLNNIQEEVDNFLNWINPQYCNNIRCTLLSKKWDVSAELDCVEIGLAVLHGILKNKNIEKGKIRFNVKNSKLVIGIGESSILKLENIIEGDVIWEISDYAKISQNTDVRKFVLVQAGYTNEIDLPEDIFYKIVRVDARPSIGGGLPDFWARTLSALVTSMKENPNFSDIVICGDVQNTKCVKDFLESISKWDDKKVRYISKKTYKSYGDILDFQKKFANHVNTFLDINELIEHIFSISQNVGYKEKSTLVDEKRKKRFIERRLSYEQIELDIVDGCRVNTIAQAFPVVLEILRKSQNSETKIVDQAGRELLELTNFKILLKTPKIERLPEYYYYDEKEIDTYYEGVFKGEKGLFIQRLEKDNQLEEMIEHVANAINEENIYATRRAILVVQNEIQIGQNYSPVGLVAIWLAPRFVNSKVVIDYSYTWRTVEAIVGLPLSLYASVKFAEEITEKIVKKVGASKCNIEMGKIAYIAHSLHMFTDEESMNIVRGIINEVSV